MAAGEAAQVRGGDVQAGPGQRDALGADRGLRAGPLTGPQRRVDQLGDGRAAGSRRGGRAGGFLDLGDNLFLANGHRIKPAGDREQVLGGRAAVADAGYLEDLAEREPAPGGHQARDGLGGPSGRA
jgi:hypothetical protein